MKTIHPITHAERILTERQLEIFKLIGEGKKAVEIAKILFISKKTVWSHRADLMGKMGFKNTYQLMYHAIRFNLINNHHKEEKV